ncbi:MAG TPA: pentapeptide repeat-containing protein, partial [Solirubrobacteraceae bacterium]|nr:pentapeptide repeat-containing protein [Solirubrobacteraceae bacterium]
MQDVLCEGQLEATLDADEVSIRRSRLERGGRITLARGRLSLEDARLARPTLIAATRGQRSEAPRLGHLSGADLSGTTLSGLDLTHTRFVGGHG